MNVTGLDGRAYKLDLTGRVPLGSEQGGSAGHARCRSLLARLFPCDRRLEEVPLPGSGHRDLRADFFLPGRRLVAEVHGRQHYEFVYHFHITQLGFLQAQARDVAKREWCELNRIVYCELPDHEPDERWTERLLSALRPTNDGPTSSPGG